MKLWLNTLLECPDDHSYPFHIYIFKWLSPKQKFIDLLKAYEAKYLVNFKDEKKPLEIQVFELSIFSDAPKLSDSEKVFNENKRITSDVNFKNIICIFVEENKIKIKDYNFVRPDSLINYFNFYLNMLNELKFTNDLSEYDEAKKILKLINESIYNKINEFFKMNKDKIEYFDSTQNKNETEIVYEILDFIKDIFQDLLFLNYYLYLFEIQEGLLVCPSCKKWNPIIKTIPRIFPKSMQRQKIDINFMEQWKNLFPSDLI